MLLSGRDGPVVIEPFRGLKRQDLKQPRRFVIGPHGRAALRRAPENIGGHVSLGKGIGPEFLDLDLCVQFLRQRIIGIQDLAFGIGFRLASRCLKPRISDSVS